MLIYGCGVKTYPVDLNNPATWRFLQLAFPPFHTAEEQIQYPMNVGANGFYMMTWIDSWNAQDWEAQQRVKHAQEVHRSGGLVYIENYPLSWIGTGSEFWNLIAQNQREVINNQVVGGVNQQDEYIQWVKNCLGDNGNPNIDADIIQIMNEARGDSYPNDYNPSSDAFWANYINFCNRFMSEIDELRVSQGKPHPIFTVSSLPFYKLAPIADKTFQIPSGCRLLYSFHEYYSWGNEDPSTWADYRPDQIAYWNNGVQPLTSAQRQTARNLLSDYWLNISGLNALWSKGKTVVFDEQGTHINNPNMGAWLEDAIDFCYQHNLGMSHWNNVSGTAIQSTAGCIFNSTDPPTANDYTLNAIGQVWKQKMDSLAPQTQVVLPFNDKFASLDSKWQQIAGTWSTV